MEKKLFEEMSKEIVESAVGKTGSICVEVNRNSKKDKENTYYDTIYSVYGSKVECSEDGDELTVLDGNGRIRGHIHHKALTKNYDVLSLSCNGEYIGGFDMDKHNEKVMEKEQREKELLEMINDLDGENRQKIEEFIDSLSPKEETGVTVKEDGADE
jgi:hypothetical protein